MARARPPLRSASKVSRSTAAPAFSCTSLLPSLNDGDSGGANVTILSSALADHSTAAVPRPVVPRVYPGHPDRHRQVQNVLSSLTELTEGGSEDNAAGRDLCLAVHGRNLQKRCKSAGRAVDAVSRRHHATSAWLYLRRPRLRRVNIGMTREGGGYREGAFEKKATDTVVTWSTSSGILYLQGFVGPEVSGSNGQWK